MDAESGAFIWTTKAHRASISKNMHYSHLSVGREQQHSDMELTWFSKLCFSSPALVSASLAGLFESFTNNAPRVSGAPANSGTRALLSVLDHVYCFAVRED